VNPAIQTMRLPVIIHINAQTATARIPGLVVILTTQESPIASRAIKKIVPVNMMEANAQTVIPPSLGAMMIWHSWSMVPCRKLTARNAIIPLRL
jgi:hypothetical protein